MSQGPDSIAAMGHLRSCVATLAIAATIMAAYSACAKSQSGSAAGDVDARRKGSATERRLDLTDSPPPQAETADKRLVVHAIDGDTFDTQPLGGGRVERIRLIGVDTPETKDPRKPVQCFGKEASDFTAQLMGHTVRLTYDAERNDHFGRTLAYVWLDDGSFFNLILAQEGFARPLEIAPNTGHAREFADAARQAQGARKGLWSACGSTTG